MDDQVKQKTRGVAFWEAAKNHLYADGELSHEERCDRAAAEYDKARAQLPADVEVFVAECEAVHASTSPGPWVVRRDESDPDDPADTIYCVNGFGPWTHVEHKDADCFASVGDIDGNDAGFACHAHATYPRLITIIRAQGAELASVKLAEGLNKIAFDALRDRLAKLETLGREVVSYYVPENECECDGCAVGRKFAELLGVTEDGTTQTK